MLRHYSLQRGKWGYHMDNFRGHFPELGGSDDDAYDRDYGEDDIGHEPPPASIGQDERRMQVRAYNYWASLLDNRSQGGE